MKRSAKLTEIRNDRTITSKEDPTFFRELEQSVLLALKENGSLTETQLRAALDTLNEEFRAAARKIKEEEC